MNVKPMKHRIFLGFFSATSGTFPGQHSFIGWIHYKTKTKYLFLDQMLAINMGPISSFDSGSID